MKGFRILAFLPLALGVACAPTQDSVDVNVYHLSRLSLVDKKNPMMRAEQQRLLRGAVSLDQRRDRMGQYYTVRWDVRQQPVSEPLRVVFSYRQASTGSKILTQAHSAGELKKGLCEFKVAGADYHKGGRVLSWKVQVFAGSKKLVSEQSYLWE